MQLQRKTAQELRKSIYRKSHNPQHNKFILDIISEKIGQQNLAYVLVIFASIVYPLGFLYPNQNKFSPFETSLMRGLMTSFINFLIARHYNIQIDFTDPQNFRILFVRNFIMVLQGLVYAVIQFYLTQPIIQTLSCTGPLFIFLLDYQINGITITQKQLYGVVLGIIGVLLTVNGEVIIRLIDPSYTTTTEFKNYSSDNPMDKLISALAFVFIQFLWAYAQILTKKLHQVNSIQINFHLGISILLCSGLIYPTQVINPVHTTKFIASLFSGGLLMVCGQLSFIGAITMTKNTGVLTMLSFVSVIVGYVVSITKYKEQINPFCTIGGILIIFGLAKIVLKDKTEQQLSQNQSNLKNQLQKR